MKNFFLKHKFVIILLFFVCIIEIGIFSICFGTETLEEDNFELGVVNTDYLNLRIGPGTNYTSISMLTKNQYVKIHGKIGDWYIVQDETDTIGTVHSNYIKPTNETKSAVNNIEAIEEVGINMTDDEKKILTLINNEREKNNLEKLEIDKNLQNIARLKAEDIVKNNYFSHVSPTYGTPFEMLRNNNIQYKTASENIAGNNSLEDAVSSWMSSESHKRNILSNHYNYTGIAVVNSIAYGKIIVQFFIGK